MRILQLVSFPDEEFLRTAYRQILGRDIDTHGLADYGRQLSKGKSKEAVLVDIARSREAQSRFAPPALLDLPEEAFIDAIYVRLLGRNADAGGMRNYLAQLHRHGDRARIIQEIGCSEEARRHDPLGWAFRAELALLIRRETSFLGWRKLSLRCVQSVAPRGSPADEIDLVTMDLLEKNRMEKEKIQDQIRLLSSALDGLTKAFQKETSLIHEKLNKIEKKFIDM